MPQISFDTKELSSFCRDNRIRKLSLFGSILRADFNPDSDIDILVEFEPGAAPGLFGISRLERELIHMFKGRRIDLRTAEDLSPYFRSEVLSQAEVLYAQK